MNSSLNVSSAISKGWEAAKKHWLVLVGLFIAYMIIYMLISFFLSFSYAAQLIVSFIISSIFNVGYLKMYMNAINGEEPDFSVFKNMINRVIPFIVVNFLFSLIVVIGLCLLIFPGIYFALRFMPSYYLILDNPEIGIIDAFKKAWKMTEGNAWNLFVITLFTIGITILGLLALIVGVFFTTIVSIFVFTAAYYQLKDNYSRETNIIADNNTY